MYIYREFKLNPAIKVEVVAAELRGNVHSIITLIVFVVSILGERWENEEEWNWDKGEDKCKDCLSASTTFLLKLNNTDSSTILLWYDFHTIFQVWTKNSSSLEDAWSLYEVYG